MPSEPTVITMNVSLPQPLKKYVDGRVSSGIYGSASEFVREAIREKLQRDLDRDQAKTLLTAELLKGLDSGPSIAFTNSYFKSKKQALQRRVRSSKRA